jgi:hypothetical protein
MDWHSSFANIGVDDSVVWMQGFSKEVEKSGIDERSGIVLERNLRLLTSKV